MPIFEYQCQTCWHVFEVITLRVGRGKTVRCPKCGSSEVDRLLSSFAGRVGGGAGCASGGSGTG
jgi:putative FmdB family regulatory protein